MAANTATLLPDFPISIGNRRLSTITLTGPSSYAAVNIGTPPTGGQALLASQFGLKYLDSVTCSLDSTGKYTGFWTPASTTTNGVTAGILQWVQTSGGIEASGDLSAMALRVTAIGR